MLCPECLCLLTLQSHTGPARETAFQLGRLSQSTLVIQGLQMSSRYGRGLELWEVLAGGLQPGAFLVALVDGTHSTQQLFCMLCSDWENIDF